MPNSFRVFSLHTDRLFYPLSDIFFRFHIHVGSLFLLTIKTLPHRIHRIRVMRSRVRPAVQPSEEIHRRNEVSEAWPSVSCDNVVH